jgi:endonuclease G
VLCRKDSPKAIAFVFRNQGKKMTMLEAVRTVDEVERMTGFDLFPQMDDVTEQRIEAEADLEDW